MENLLLNETCYDVSNQGYIDILQQERTTQGKFWKGILINKEIMGFDCL